MFEVAALLALVAVFAVFAIPILLIAVLGKLVLKLLFIPLAVAFFVVKVALVAVLVPLLIVLAVPMLVALVAAVIPVVIGGMEETFVMWKALFDGGVFTNPVMPPAVPESSCRLRISLMATHTDDHIDAVLEAFASVGREMAVI